MPRTAVIVLGMHRSGTSMLAGVLDALGCKGPKTLAPANASNERGYFESKEIYKLNDIILAAMGTRWDDWRPLESDRLESVVLAEFREKAADLVKAEYGAASLIYLKDPRICRLLPFWRDILEGLGFRVVCIHTHRNPNDVMASLARRVRLGVEPGSGLLIWLRHILDAENGSRDLPRVFTSYSGVLNNWHHFSDQAESRFEISWPEPIEKRDKKVQALIDPSLRHHDSDLQTSPTQSNLPKPVLECMRVLVEWETEGESDKGRAVLDRLRSRFNEDALMYSKPLSELEVRLGEAVVENKSLARSMLVAKAKLTKREQKIIALQEEIDRMRYKARHLIKLKQIVTSVKLFRRRAG